MRMLFMWRYWAWVIALTATPFCNQVLAGPHGGGPQVTTGVIYKQGLVLEEKDGENVPMFAEYDAESGALVQLLSDFDATDKDLWIGNGEEYRASAQSYAEFYKDLSEEIQDRLKVITVDEYKDLPYPEGFEKGEPYASSRSLLVYRPDALDKTVQLDAEKGLIVYESRYDLDEFEKNTDIESGSLLLDKNGQIKHSTDNNIGFRVAYIKPDETSDIDERMATYRPGKELVSPVTNAWVSNGLNPNGKFPTDQEGRYESYYYISPCPGFTHYYSIPMYAAVPYRSFNPLRKGSLNHYMFSGLSGYICVGAPFHGPLLNLASKLDFLTAYETYAFNQPIPTQAHFEVDVTIISGEFTFSNENDGQSITIGEETIYKVEEQEETEFELPENPDFNADDIEDHVSDIGSIEGENPEDDPLFGVWFYMSDETPKDDKNRPLDDEDNVIEPDLVRVARKKPVFDNIGLLEEISKEDALETDIYVFRESTGELVMEKAPFSLGENDALNNVEEEIPGGYFELTIPGRDASNSFRNIHSFGGAYEDWQASIDITKSFQGRVDSLRVGEPIRVIAINRVTGYIGSIRTDIKTATHSTVGIELKELVLYPPNLKVRVERQYSVEKGLTKGEERRYKVGAEGAALTSDQFVAIRTEWLDHEGGQLPAQLPGYTARLSSLVDDNTLNSNVKHFSVKPGKHIKVLDLKGASGSLGEAHLYFHMVGTPFDEKADFSLGDEGLLQFRPKKYVPVRVAVYDEEASRELKKVQFELDEKYIKQDSAIYQWPYRPEMMYSVYSLDVKRIERTPGEDEEPIEITDEDDPTLSAEDSELSIAHEFEVSDYDPLKYFGPDSDIVYSLEGYEKQVHAGSSEYDFSSLSHLGNLNGKDFLTLNLLNNQDAGNVLWEWAFDYLYIDTPVENEFNEFAEETFYIYADDPVVKLVAGTMGYKIDRDGEPRTVGLQWKVDGDGTLKKARTREKGKSGYVNTLTMSTETGAKATVSVQIDGDSSTEVSFYEVVVLPGEASNLGVTTSGQVGLDGTSMMTIDAVVRDRHGNLVPDNYPVGFSIAGQGILSRTLAYTKAGIATSTVTGGFSAGAGGQVVIDVNDIYEVIDFDVVSPTLSVSGLPDNTSSGQSHALSVRVRGAGGSSPAGIFVSSSVDQGTLTYVDNQHTTDDNGDISFVWHVAENPTTEATLSLRVGNEQLFEQRVPITQSDGTPGVSVLEELQRIGIVANSAMVVGDRASAGTVDYGGIVTGSAVDFAYDTVDTVRIVNNSADPSGQTAQLTLGSLAYPNRTPSLVLEGGTLRRYGFVDETGKVDLDAVNLRRVADHPVGGGHAYVFSSTNQATSQLKTNLQPVQGKHLGQLSIKASQIGGQLVQIGNNLTLSLNADRRLSLTLSVDGVEGDTTVTVRSAPIQLDQWYQLAYQVTEEFIVLSVDSTLYEQSIPNGSSFSTELADLVIGKGFAGLITSIRWYAMDSAPLLLFGNNDEKLEQVLPQGATDVVTVAANNSLNLSTISGFRGQKVSFSVDDESTTIDVITAAEYRRAASVLQDTVAPGLDWTAFKARYRATVVNDTRNLYKNVLANKLNTSSTGYSELNAITALFSVLNALPENKILRSSLSTIHSFYGEHQSNNFMQAAAARYLYQQIEPLLSRENVRLDPLAVPLTVMAEMLEFSPVAGNRFASSIKSEVDFNTWMRLFALPANGWAGVYPPVPSLTGECDDGGLVVKGKIPEYEMPFLPCRATGEQTADLINAIWEQGDLYNEYPHLAVELVEQLLEILPVANMYVRLNIFPVREKEVGFLFNLSPIKEAKAALPALAIPVLVRTAARLLVAGGRAAGTAAAVYTSNKIIKEIIKKMLKDFLLGENARIHPLALLGAVTYLDSRMADDKCDGDKRCVEIKKEKIIKSIDSLKRKVTGGALIPNREEIGSDGKIQCRIDADAFGAAFELWVTAYVHMRHEQLEDPDFELINLQEGFSLNLRRPKDNFFKANQNLDKANTRIDDEDHYVRYSDIVIKGKEKKRIIELKSYKIPVRDKKKPAIGKKYVAITKNMTDKTPRWDVVKRTLKIKKSSDGEVVKNADGEDETVISRGGTTMHRQILLDMYMTREQLDESGEVVVEADDFRWYIHAWKPQYDKKKNLNDTVGIGIGSVEVVRSKKTYNGPDFIAHRLSTFGGTSDRSRELIAFNLGFKPSVVKKKSVEAFTGPLYEDLGLGNGEGLKDKVKKFGLFGTLESGQINQLLLDVFGIDPKGDLAKVLKDEELEWLETLQEHVEQIEDLLEEGTKKFVDTVISPEKRKEYEEQLKELEGDLEQLREEALAATTSVLPEVPANEQKCL